MDPTPTTQSACTRLREQVDRDGNDGSADDHHAQSLRHAVMRDTMQLNGTKGAVEDTQALTLISELAQCYAPSQA